MKLASSLVIASVLISHAAGLSVPVLCDWDPNDMSTSLDDATLGLTQCEINTGPIPLGPTAPTTLAIFYASTLENPEEGQCPGGIFTAWSQDNASAAIIDQQIRDCCIPFPQRLPAIIWNGPKKKVWSSIHSAEYPSCLTNSFANGEARNRKAQMRKLEEGPEKYTFGNEDIGTINFVWENNLTVAESEGDEEDISSFGFVNVDYYPPRYFQAGTHPTIKDEQGNYYVLQTYLTTHEGLSDDPGIDEAYLSYIGRDEGQCCSNLPEGWTVSIEEHDTPLCAGCCTCSNQVFMDDNSWTWALVSGAPPPPGLTTPPSEPTTPPTEPTPSPTEAVIPPSEAPDSSATACNANAAILSLSLVALLV